MMVCLNERMTRFLLLPVMAVVCAGPVHASQGSLDDLRATLHKLEAPSRIDGTLVVKSDTTEGKGDAAKHLSTTLRLHVRADDGLSLSLSPGLLKRVMAEKSKHAADAIHAMPTSDLLDQIQVLDVQGMVSAGSALFYILDDAASPTVKPTHLHGKPVNMLSVTLPEPKRDDDDPEMKDYVGKATVWLGQDGVPVAFSYSRGGKFCKFFLCMTVKQSESGALQVINGRLVAVKWVKAHTQSGLGQDYQSHTVYALQVRHAHEPAAASTAKDPGTAGG